MLLRKALEIFQFIECIIQMQKEQEAIIIQAQKLNAIFLWHKVGTTKVSPGTALDVDACQIDLKFLNL